MNRRPLLHRCLILLLALSTAAAARAQSPPPAAADVPASTPAELPSGFLIGPDDVLSIVFWRDKDMTAQVTVRPDGNISLPLLNDVRAAGLTPAELRARLIAESKRYFDNPNVTVIVLSLIHI